MPSTFPLWFAPGCTDTPIEEPRDWEIPCATADVEPIARAPAEAFDCGSIPAAPLSMTELDAPRGYHDLAFDAAGRMIGADTAFSLLAVAGDDTLSVYATGLAESEQMDWLPGGDLAVSTHLGIVRVAPDGGVSPISSASPFGLITGPDGLLYTASWMEGVQRLDPETGASTTLIDESTLAPRVINFSPDFTKLYIGSDGGDGEIYAVPLDADLDPSGLPTLVAATNPGEGTFHDTFGVDVCGNLYVTDYQSDALRRVTPDGVVSTLVDFVEIGWESYGHGLEWGSGLGGWKHDAIYLSQPADDNRVMEVEIGVPSRCWTGGGSPATP